MPRALTVDGLVGRRLSVVLVAYHSERVLEQALSSISASLPEAEVIVVDNGSPLHAGEPTVKYADGVIMITGQGNVGFGAGCNLGALHSSREAIFFLNPDATIQQIDTAILNEVLDSELLGLVAPTFADERGRLFHAVYPYSGLTRELVKHTLGNVTPRQMKSRSGQVRHGKEGWVSGAAFVVRRTEFADAGGFDERYFLYYEDQDIGRRYRLRGLPVRCSNGIVVRHQSGTSSDADEASVIALSASWLSWLQYVALWHSERRARQMASIGTSLQHGTQRVVATLAGLTRATRARRKADLLAAQRVFVDAAISQDPGTVPPLRAYSDARQALRSTSALPQGVLADEARRSAARLSRPGYDPFDALRSPLLRSVSGDNPRARQVCVQLRKRGFLPASALLGIEPFRMAKTLGCMLSSMARLHVAGSVDEQAVRSVARDLLTDPMLAHDPLGGWGYEFDVQTRWAFYPSGSANIIATLFVTRGLAEAGLAVGDTELLEHSARGAAYMLEHLQEQGSEGGYFRYAPTSASLIHNANLLAAGVVAAVGQVTHNPTWVQDALHCAEASITSVRTDGLWPYGQEAGLGWVDNFHSAYPLDGVMLLWLATGDPRLQRMLHRGVSTWSEQFFGADGEPYYFLERHRPYDIHAAGTAIDVGARLEMAGLGAAGLAKRVSEWGRENLCDRITGETRYQTGASPGAKRHFVRWGEAHWALGLSSLSLLEGGQMPPLEAELMRNGGAS